MSRDGKYLYAALEGPKVTDSDQSRRWIYEFSVRRKAFTGRVWPYRTENAAFMISDMSVLDDHRIVVMERRSAAGFSGPVSRSEEWGARSKTAVTFVAHLEMGAANAHGSTP